MSKISGYSAITSVQADDVLPVVDVHDTSMASTGTTKKITLAQVAAVAAADYAPTGLTGATAASRYVGGTVSGAPVSGTFAAGDFVVDQAGTIWVCTAGGTPGTWVKAGVALDGTAADIQPLGVQAAGAKGQAADAKHVHPLQPWQFMPEAYGAKRDGAFLYDAAMTNGLAVLTTAGLPAPAAPSVSNSGSGGTVAAGVYQVKITYVNVHGETLASPGSPTTTSGSTSKITVTSPAPWTNATGYYVYCTQAGGSSYTRQQAPGSPTPLRTSYVITAPPTSGGAAPPGADTSHSAPFTAGDVGKALVVPSAGGFANVPLVTTIASFQSATQVTLAATALSTVTGSGAVYGTDDTAAIQAAINAAVAYAQTAGTEQAVAEVVFSNGIYCVAGALGGTYQNAQIQIPYVNPYAGPKVNLKFTGPQASPGPIHWEQPNPPAAGATIASIYYSDSGSPPTPGPAVIGGPVTGGGVNFGGTGGLFSNMRVIVDGLSILAAYRPSINGLDLYGVAQADIKSFSYFCMARTATAAGGWPPYLSAQSNPSPWQTIGYRTPTTGNNAQNDIDRLTVYGPYHAMAFSDHLAAASVKAIYCFYATGIVSPAAGTAHHCEIASLCSEATYSPVYCDGSAGLALTIPSLQAEDATYLIYDPSNLLYGEVRTEELTLTGVIAGGKNGAANIRLVWDFQPLGPVASPPSVPASTTAYSNQFWRDAVVIVTGGTVSAIAIDGKTTGLTSGPVRVRNGGTITLTYSVAPSWQWVLE